VSDQVPTLSPIDRRPTSDVIADELRERIVDGSLAPGAQLGEVALAEQPEVSRGPVREAMQRLVQEGLLVAERYRGVFVATLDADDVADIYVARAAVERAAAAEVVRRGDTAAIDELDALVAKMEGVVAGARPSWARLADLDLSFHETLVAAAGSRRLVRMYDTLVAETRMCLAALEPDYRDRTEIVAEHQSLVAALRDGDGPAVAAAVDGHLRQAVARRHADDDGVDGVDDTPADAG
jgi:DNA-binding GntR family transcriptional regulator